MANPLQDDRRQQGAQASKGGLLRAVILLGLPWLSLQRDILNLIKANLDKPRQQAKDEAPSGSDTILDVIHKLTARELQALLMILDPSHAWRRGLREDVQKSLDVDLAEISRTFAAGASQIIDAQAKTLDRLVALLSKIK